MAEAASALWVPDSYRSRAVSKAAPTTLAAVQDQPREPGQIRSTMFPSTSLALGFARPAAVGSPHVTRQELIGLFRRHSWIRGALRRIALIAIAEGWEILPADDVDSESASQEEYDYFTSFFEPEIENITNIRQMQLPRQKWYVTFLRLRLLGEVYWEIVRNGFGDPVDWTLMFGQVLPLVDKYGEFGDLEAAFVQIMGSTRAFFPMQDVLRFEVPDVDGRLGVSDLEAAELAVTTDLYAQVWNRNTFKNNRTPPGAYMFAPTTTDDDMRQNREALDAVYGGVENANKAYIALKGVVEYKTFGQPWGRDQEYLRGRTFNRNELLALLGVSAGVLGEISDVNRANLEGLIEILYRQEVQPLQDIVEESVNLWARAVGIQDWVFHFRRPSFGDEGAETKNAETRIKSGQATPNKERVRQGKAPYPAATASTCRPPFRKSGATRTTRWASRSRKRSARRSRNWRCRRRPGTRTRTPAARARRATRATSPPRRWRSWRSYGAGSARPFAWPKARFVSGSPDERGAAGATPGDRARSRSDGSPA